MLYRAWFLISLDFERGNFPQWFSTSVSHKLGNRNEVNFWHDKWVGDLLWKIVFQGFIRLQWTRMLLLQIWGAGMGIVGAGYWVGGGHCLLGRRSCYLNFKLCCFHFLCRKMFVMSGFGCLTLQKKNLMFNQLNYLHILNLQRNYDSNQEWERISKHLWKCFNLFPLRLLFLLGDYYWIGCHWDSCWSVEVLCMRFLVILVSFASLTLSVLAI